MNLSRKEFFKIFGKSALAASLFLGVKSSTGKERKSMKSSSAGFKITVKTKRLELKHSWKLSRSVSTHKEPVYIKLEKDGVFGLGEAAHNQRYNETVETTLATIEKSRPILESMDPWHYVDIMYQVYDVCEGQTSAKCAIDMALMDWITKKLGVPYYQFLGLDKSRAPRTTFSIGMDSPEIIKEKIKEAEIYPILKIKLGGPDDEEIMAAIRSVTDKPLRVDANEGWKERELCLRKVEWLHKNGVEIVEQPMPADMLEATAWVRERSPIPIFADESVKSAADIPNLAGVFDGINIKIDKAAGLQEALRMIWLARTLDLKIMLGCMVSSSLSITAAAHISPLTDYPDLDGNLLIRNDPFQGVGVVDGWLKLPDGPGLGVTGEF